MKKMVRDLATPWQELRSMIQSSLERDNQSIQDLMDDSMDFAGKIESLPSVTLLIDLQMTSFNILWSWLTPLAKR
jgi:hypothetical protein